MLLEQSQEVEKLTFTLGIGVVLTINADSGFDVLIQFGLEVMVQVVVWVLKARTCHYPQFLEGGHGSIEFLGSLFLALTIHDRYNVLLLNEAPIRNHPQDHVLGKLVEGAEEAAGNDGYFYETPDNMLLISINFAYYLSNHNNIMLRANEARIPQCFLLLTSNIIYNN